MFEVEPPAGDVVRHTADERGSGISQVFLNGNQASAASCSTSSTRRAATCRSAWSAPRTSSSNMRPDAVHRLVVGFEDVAAVNPRTVYCAVRGFGIDGPLPGRGRKRRHPHVRHLDRLHAGTFTGPTGVFRQRTELSKPKGDLLASLDIPAPKLIIELAAQAAGQEPRDTSLRGVSTYSSRSNPTSRLQTTGIARNAGKCVHEIHAVPDPRPLRRRRPAGCSRPLWRAGWRTATADRRPLRPHRRHSTGGIIALGLGMGPTPREIVKFYAEQGPRIFRNRSRTRGLRRLVRAKYPAEPLHDALVQVFGQRRFGDSTERLIIPSYYLGEDDVYLLRTLAAAREAPIASPCWSRRGRRVRR